MLGWCWLCAEEAWLQSFMTMGCVDSGLADLGATGQCTHQEAYFIIVWPGKTKNVEIITEGPQNHPCRSPVSCSPRPRGAPCLLRLDYNNHKNAYYKHRGGLPSLHARTSQVALCTARVTAHPRHLEAWKDYIKQQKTWLEGLSLQKSSSFLTLLQHPAVKQNPIRNDSELHSGRFCYASKLLHLFFRTASSESGPETSESGPLQTTVLNQI